MLAGPGLHGLTNSIDMEGDLPEELTAEFEAKIEIEGRDPVVMNDMFSGSSGGRAPAALYSQVAGVVRCYSTTLKPLQITRIECDHARVGKDG